MYNLKNRLSSEVKTKNGEGSRAKFNSIDSLAKQHSS